MSKTLIVLNPHAGGGQAGRVWRELEPILWDELGELVIAVTQHPDEVAPHLDKAHAAGLKRVIAIGGDGTNHALINALAAFNAAHAPEDAMIYGSIPIGTGRDWARGIGIPYNDYRAAARWIAHAQPRATDIGKVSFAGGSEYFLNIASAGIGGDVVRRVNRVQNRRPWTFLRAVVTTIITHRPAPMEIVLDGWDEWYDGKAYALVVANGSHFGHGMKIAPHARTEDGLFEVVLIEGVPQIEVLAALRSVYNGSHLTHRAVRYARARQVEIRTPNRTVDIEVDGEPLVAPNVSFAVQPGLLRILS